MKEKIISIKILVLTAGLIALLAGLSGCAGGSNQGLLSNSMAGALAGNSTADAPGLYDLKAWNGVAYANSNPNSADNRATAIDVYGNIGQKFYLSGPRATVKPPSATWTENVHIINGSLPPGLSFDSNFNIVGTPTQAGGWIATFSVDNIQCSSKPNFTFYGFQQLVWFHISESGQQQQTYSQPTQTPSLAQRIVGDWKFEKNTGTLSIRPDLSCSIKFFNGFGGDTAEGKIKILSGDIFAFVCNDCVNGGPGDTYVCQLVNDNTFTVHDSSQQYKDIAHSFIPIFIP